MSDNQPVRNCLLCHPDPCTGACRAKREADVPSRNLPEVPVVDIQALLDDGLNPQLPDPDASADRAMDLRDLSQTQAVFLRSYFCAGPCQYHKGRSCAEAGVSRRMFSHWMEDARFREAFESVDQYQLENAVSALAQLVRLGDLKAITFWLDRRGGKDWSPRAQLDLSTGGGPITGFQITVVGGGASAAA